MCLDSRESCLDYCCRAHFCCLSCPRSIDIHKSCPFELPAPAIIAIVIFTIIFILFGLLVVAHCCGWLPPSIYRGRRRHRFFYPIGTTGNCINEGEAMYPQGQAMYPQGQVMYPQGQVMYPQGQVMYPQGQAMYPQGQAMYPQGQVMYSQDQVMYMEGQYAPQAQLIPDPTPPYPVAEKEPVQEHK